MRKIYLIRHGETEWTVQEKHTGLTDIPLTPHGEKQAKALKEQLPPPASFAQILTSPLKRALRTCQLAGFSDKAAVDPDLVEWDYGRFEGQKTEDILQKNPSWDLFLQGAPEGEQTSDIERRAGRILKKLLYTPGDMALFSSGHILRALAVLYLKLPLSAGRLLSLLPASISILSEERGNPTILLWNKNKI